MGKGWHKPLQIFSFLYLDALIRYVQGVCTAKIMRRKKFSSGIGLNSVSKTAKKLDVRNPAGRNSVRVKLNGGSVLVLESKFPQIVTIILG